MSGLVVGYVAYRLLRFVFVTGRWEIVRVNLKLFMVGRYPTDELWRIAVALILIALYAGLIAGLGRPPPGASPERRRRRFRSGSASRELGVRLWPLLVGVLLLLALSTSAGPWLIALGVIAAGVVGRLAGARLPRRSIALARAGGHRRAPSSSCGSSPARSAGTTGAG